MAVDTIHEMHPQPLAYRDHEFLESEEARPLRILAEYIEPLRRFKAQNIQDTVVFFGSARIHSREYAEQALERLRRRFGPADDAVNEHLSRGRKAVEWSKYYEDARRLAYVLTEWTRTLDAPHHRFVVTSGGGPGIMEAANRGASEAKGLNVGLTISIPIEEFDNRYVTRELSFHFHYFFMRKFWFAYLAKALLVFPGGFGTLDELFEILTLRQTGKMRKNLAIVLFGAEYWNEVINFDALVRHGTINREDLRLFHRTDSADEAFEIVTRHLTEHAMAERGAFL